MLEGVHPAALQLFKDHGYSDIEVKRSQSEEDLVQNQRFIAWNQIKTQLTKILDSADRLILSVRFV